MFNLTKIIKPVFIFTVLFTVVTFLFAQQNVINYDRVLKVEHIPIDINDIPEDFLEKLKFPYVRFYRTEVINNTDKDIKIVWFDAFFKFDGIWTSRNIKNKVLRNEDFIQWYGKANMISGNWLPPGAKAVCDVNWHWTETADDIPSKWAFIAIDKFGNDYYIEKIVPNIKPIKLNNN